MHFQQLSLTLVILFVSSSSCLAAQESLPGDSNTTEVVKVDSIPDNWVVDSAANVSSSELEFTRNLEFAQHLITQSLFDDGQFLLTQLSKDTTGSVVQRDSAIYLTAWLHYYQRDFERALLTLNGIDNSSSIWNVSSFLAATCHLYLKNVATSKEIYQNLNNLSSNEDAIRLLNLSGIALLERNYSSFDSIAALIPADNFMVSSEVTSLHNHAAKMMAYKRKSPWIAGFLSAILPGLGKYYVGYRGTPFGALTLNIPLAAVAVETLIISGVTGIPFLIAGPIFGIFYLGNIWGSVLSANAHKREFYDEMDHNILYDLHIPVRRLF